jgi:hypothetical protein
MATPRCVGYESRLNDARRRIRSLQARLERLQDPKYLASEGYPANYLNTPSGQAELQEIWDNTRKFEELEKEAERQLAECKKTEQEELKKAAEDKKAAEEKAKADAQPTAAQETKANPQNPPANPNAAESQAPAAAEGAETKSVSEDQSAPSASSVTTKSVSQQASKEPAVSKVRPNALSQLSSYNYIIDLQATDKQGLINLQQSEEYNPADWLTMISSSGGVGGAGVLRNADGSDNRQWFKKEYYLDDLEFISIVGLNSNARASADTEVNFTITEPYGINFIQELWEFNTESLRQENWTETCYLLRITFKGYTDDGELQKLNIVKYLPLKITTIEIKLTSSGSVYTVKAVPFNQQGNDKRYGVLQKGIQCEGKTLYDIILGEGGTIDLAVADDDYYKVTGLNPLTLIEKPSNLKYALNKESQSEAEANKASKSTPAYPTEYDFDFINDLGLAIGEALVSKSEEIDPKDTSMNLPKDQQESQMLKNLNSYQLLGQRNSSDIKINVENQKVNFNAGQIVEILSQLIINSTYITDQVKEFRENYRAALAETNPEARKTKLELLKKPFNWFRIVPKIYNTGKYNQSSNLDQKRVVFQITGYEIQNPKGVGGQLVPSSKTANIEKEVVKEYFYFFTGKNTEIINLDISLNTSYFSYRPRNAQIYSQATGVKPQAVDQTAAGVNINTNALKVVKDPLNAAITTVAAPKNERPSVGMGTTTLDRNVSGQVTSALYSNVDQLSINMEIIGDPDLIKQDGVFRTAVEDGDDVPISFDNRERYIRVVFANPRDIDDETGTIDRKGALEQNMVFNGLYKLLEIRSSFKQGKFSQQLQLLRSVSDPEDQPVEIAKTQDAAAKSGLFEPPSLNIFDTPNIKDIKPVIGVGSLFGNFPPPPSR